MLRKHKTLWRQLNGPQITAIFDVIWAYHVEKYDKKLEYFDNMTLESANMRHIAFIGKLMQFPLLPIRSLLDFEKFLRYTRIRYGDDPPKLIYGLDSGVFDFPVDSQHYNMVDLPDNIYRKILRTLGSIDGFSRGLNLVDYLASILLVRANGDIIPYTIEYVKPWGDIVVKVIEDPGYSFMVFNMICEKLFASQPTVILEVELPEP